MIRIDHLSSRQLIAVFIISLLFGMLLLGWAERAGLFVGGFPVGVDIYPRWVGSRAFWQGESPYSAAVELETQQYIFGRSAQPGEDKFGFYYPAHAAIILAPLTLLPAAMAAMVGAAFSWAILSLIAFVMGRSMSNQVSIWVWLLVTLTVFLQRSALLVVLNGQYALFVLALWAGAYYLMRHNYDIGSGVLLALTTIKPTLSFLPLLVFLFWAFRNGRAKIILSFLLTLTLLFIVSVAQIGWWIPEFLAQLTQYDDFPRQWVTGNIISVPGFIWLGGTLVLLFVGVQAYRQNGHDFPWWLLCGAISLSLLVTPHTAEYDIVILLLPLILYTPYFLQTKIGFVIWLILWWLPWLTWGAFQLLGYGTGDWLALFWWHVPQIWVLAFVAFYFLSRSTWPVATMNQGVTP